MVTIFRLALFLKNLDKIIEGADHNIVIAEVIDAGVQSDELPLNLRSTGWSYGG